MGGSVFRPKKRSTSNILARLVRALDLAAEAEADSSSDDDMQIGDTSDTMTKTILGDEYMFMRDALKQRAQGGRLTRASTDKCSGLDKAACLEAPGDMWCEWTVFNNCEENTDYYRSSKGRTSRGP